MKCEQCNSETQNGFVCPDCSKNSDLNQGEFYVCNKNCQKLFWKEHKKRRQHFQALPNHEEKSKMPPWSLEDLPKKVVFEIFSYFSRKTSMSIFNKIIWRSYSLTVAGQFEINTKKC